MRGVKAKRLRKAGLKSGPVRRETRDHVPDPDRFDHKAERRSRKWKTGER